MISLTEEARKELEAYFEGKEKTPIRVYLAPGGCSGPRLALALDEPGEDDETSEDNGLTLCINKELAEKVGAVTVGMTHMGFVVESEIPLPSGGQRRRLLVLLRRLRQFRRLPLRLRLRDSPERPSRTDMLKANHPAGFPLRKKRFREKSPNERFPCHLAFVHYLLKKTDMALSRICPFPLFIIYSGGNNHVYD